MSQSAALLAARASSGAAATCSGRAHPRHVTAPWVHLPDAPAPPHSRATAAVGRTHALRAAAASKGAVLTQAAAPRPLRSSRRQLQPFQMHRSHLGPLRARSRYEDEDDGDMDEEEEEEEGLDEEDIVPGPPPASAGVREDMSGTAIVDEDDSTGGVASRGSRKTSSSETFGEEGDEDDAEDVDEEEPPEDDDESAESDDADEDLDMDLDLDDIIGDVSSLKPVDEDVLAYQDGFGASSAGEQLDDGALLPDGEAGGDSGYVAPPYTEVPVREMALGALLAAAGYGTEAAAQLDEAAAAEMVLGIFKDSRKVTEGSIFICEEGAQDDGHNYAFDAIDRGAVAIIAQHRIAELPSDFPVVYVRDSSQAVGWIASAFLEDPSERMTMIGVTGSAGKTTTCWLVRGIFEELQQMTGMIGSIEYAIAEDRMTEEGELWEPTEEDPTLERDCSAPFAISPYRGKYSVGRSTPDSLATQKLLAGMVDRGATTSVVECSQTGIQNGRVDDVNFDVVVLTGLSKENLGDYEMMEVVENAGSLFSRLTDPNTQRAVINVDDPYADDMKRCAAAVPVVSFAMADKQADVWAMRVKYSIWETEILIKTPLGQLEVITPLLGKHNVYNVLAAVAVGISLNVNLPAIGAGIESVEVVPGRCEIIDEGQAFPVIVDEAATPEAFSRLLDMIKEVGARRIFTVFGCEGDRDKAIRPILGEIAHYKSDWVVVTNSNPRTENPPDIVADVVAGFPEEVLSRHPGSVYPWLQDVGRIPSWFEPYLMNYQFEVRRYVMEDRFCAIRAAIGTAQARDVVIIAGKGAQDYQEYGDGEGGTIKGWFDDRVEARNALCKLPYLYSIKSLDRKELPWTRNPEDRPPRFQRMTSKS